MKQLMKFMIISNKTTIDNFNGRFILQKKIVNLGSVYNYFGSEKFDLNGDFSEPLTLFSLTRIVLNVNLTTRRVLVLIQVFVKPLFSL